MQQEQQVAEAILLAIIILNSVFIAPLFCIAVFFPTVPIRVQSELLIMR
jgi:hypothetical protein